MRRNQGFTIIELLFALTLVIILASLVIIQKNNIDASTRDRERKTAINAFYYGLKEGYYKEHKSYPTTLSKENLPYIDPALFKDPQGKVIGQNGSDYHYFAKDCEGNNCTSFELRVKLEKEAEYTKSS